MADIAKLKQAGIHTVAGAQMTTRRNLTKIKGFSEIKVLLVDRMAQSGTLNA
jgi:hypothetical protein